ncbi:MotA/TolQ/ExbB proton channel family protein [Rubellicoccus peritrichatus]|uniref:MotA/TolQ/ExbB proton channel family protein n=1 Tax=Rubellicoccus peritrichatus TaxID=3080537 RepID=A0AAQ3LHU1_9BACT|nr:MotA/TolQ/ExbB proton channel family protein [Puniceicoccus sp. CR14]WOO42349.1 MotA/TolQ/ExbB proton channel family protein [Puniceicoccus sp. CR14]
MAFLPLITSAQEEAGDIATSGGQSLWGLIQQGGWAMWPLGLCCLFMFFLAIYCWRETARKKYVPEAILPQASGFLRVRDIQSAINTLQSANSVLSRVMVTGLGKAKPNLPDANKGKVELMLSESLEAEENQAGQWVNYLNVIAAVAPMIGLLGTVSGMISAFQTISLGGMGRPELLAGDIGEALITTATGLVIGIPAMIAYFILKNRLGNSMIATVQAASNLVDDLAGENNDEGQEAEFAEETMVEA